jgi:hypothetical protein
VSVRLQFGGWFQCRLATDPDPHDEPRGVSGYARAVAGEPDLDRVVRFQPAGAFVRSHCPEVGVRVTRVIVDGRPVDGHPLVGATVDLLDEPVFEGRNGIVADDGFEPIVPFHLRVEGPGGLSLQRRAGAAERFPFTPLKPRDVQLGLSDIADATGIWDLAAVWRERASMLRAEAGATTHPTVRAAAAARLRALDRGVGVQFFGARMIYGFDLAGRWSAADPEGVLPGPVAEDPWPIEFWMGGWDADAFCGFVRGSIGIATEREVGVADDLPATARLVRGARVIRP